MKKKKIYRDAVTGEFVEKEYAKANPSTTVSETVEIPDVEPESEKVENEQGE